MLRPCVKKGENCDNADVTEHATLGHVDVCLGDSGAIGIGSEYEVDWNA